MIPVILSGGSGTRLWPVSRKKYPKQFAKIFDESLFNKTLKRLKILGSPWSITTSELKTLTEGSYRELGLEPQAIYEPFGRNTAPAIGALCRLFMLKGLSEEVVGIFPADHFIEKEDEYLAVLRLAESIAKKGSIVTVGIRPRFPATGFGYIETTPDVIESSNEAAGFKAVRFREKPDLPTAERFVKSGNFYWNAGNFIFKISTMAKLFEKHQPTMWKILQTLKADQSNIDDVYRDVEANSIDFAIMEKLESHVCIPCEVGWNDVGSWDEVSRIRKNSDQVIEVNSKNNFVLADESKVFAFVGVSDTVVVETSDAVLITKKGSSQEVKTVLEKLRESGRKIHDPVFNDRNFETRPWGSFEILRDTPDFKSKVINVNPGQQLSYQSHAKRAEHWVIIKGKAQVTLNDQVHNLKPGESIYIPQGAKHRMTNPGKEVVQFVEVQVGSYFGEDDIVRYHDDYKRV